MKILFGENLWGENFLGENLFDPCPLKEGGGMIYIMLLSDLEKLLSVWENVLSIANVT